ncbi:MAG: PEP-CTERM sorting domain-containing protein [Colwellia sp.]|nr:PEP-CTERM sorting domain-containing protein [Colwellia sp.]
MKCIKAVVASVILLSFSNLTFATSTNVKECSTRTSGQYDYGNATGQEGSACHKSNYWQRLGAKSNKEKVNKAQEKDLTTNDGVSWKTSSDGVTWSEYGTSAEFTSGGLVQFQFNMTRATTGNHKYDQLKSWVDWDQNGTWEEDETIIAQKWWKNEDSEGNIATSGDTNWDLTKWGDLGTEGSTKSNNNVWMSTWNNGNGRWKDEIHNSSVTKATFFSEVQTIPVLDILSDIWLRARVVCENSLETLSDGMNLIATGYQNQGEVEDYKLTIAQKISPVTVPEPSTLFIFAMGFLTLFTRKKAKIS